MKPENRKSDVETRDVHVRFTRIATAAFVISLVAIAAALYALYHHKINSWQTASGAATSIEKQFPNPKVFWENAGELANPEQSYRWLDEDKSIAQIPVDRALELAAENQLIHLSLKDSASKEALHDQ